MRMKLVAVMILTVVALSGCLMVRGRHGNKLLITPAGVIVIPPKGHHHNEGCGHYFHGGRWYQLDDHHHGHGCGHHSDRGRWVLRDH